MPTSDNPADLISRGATADEMIHNTQWFSGPEFLWKDERFWPTFPNPFHESSNKDTEIKREIQVHLFAFPGTTLNSVIQRYSSWYKLKRGVAWLIRFKEFIKNEVYSRRALSNPSNARLLPKKLSLEEIMTAEVELIKYVQRVSFPQVLDAQKRSSSLVRQKHAL